MVFGEDSKIILLSSPFPLRCRRLQPTDSSFAAWLPFPGKKFPLTKLTPALPKAGNNAAPGQAEPERRNPAAFRGGFAPRRASLARTPGPGRRLEHPLERSPSSRSRQSPLWGSPSRLYISVLFGWLVFDTLFGHRGSVRGRGKRLQTVKTFPERIFFGIWT